MNKQDYSYVFIFYDVGEKRVYKVFKTCKAYLNHCQNSVFRGHITQANLLELKNELKKIINKKLDFIMILKMRNKDSFAEEILGEKTTKDGDLII